MDSDWHTQWAIEHIRYVRSHAKRRGLQFNLEVADILPPVVCPICQRKLEKSKSKPGPHSPSVDRFDNSLHYVKGNVNIICHRCNGLKSDGTREEFRGILAYLDNQLGPIPKRRLQNREAARRLRAKRYAAGWRKDKNGNWIEPQNLSGWLRSRADRSISAGTV